MRSFVALSLAGLLAAPIAAQDTTLVTSNADGNPCDAHTFIPCLTDNGRYLSLTTGATDFLESGGSGAVFGDCPNGRSAAYRSRAPVRAAGGWTSGPRDACALRE